MARDIAALILAVKDHAKENYANGWDEIVECYEDEDLREIIGLARTSKGAIKKVAAVVSLRNEVRRDVIVAGGVEEFYPEIFPTQEVTEIPVVDVTSEIVPEVVPADQARPVSELVDDGGYLYFPEATETGVVCGRCSEWGCRGRKVRHASAAHVRACHAAHVQQKEFADQQAAELEAEARVERFFEERGAHECEETMDYMGWGLQHA